jgi:hypothetical protein
MMELFYLNKLSLPPMGGPDMTAYEVGQRIQENIRQTLPLFEPMETDYNGALCDATFSLMFNEGGFGPMDEIPPSIQGAEVMFRFESPLSDAIEANKAQIFMAAGPMVQQAAAMDPTAAMVVDAADALRVALHGIGFPARSMRTDDEVEEIRQAESKRAEQEQMMATLQGAATAAKDMASAQGAM